MCDKSTRTEHNMNLEWLRIRLKTLWTTLQYCGLCLETKGKFFQLTTEFVIEECNITKPLKDIASAIISCDIEDYASSDMICEECTEKTVQSYIFIENTKKVFNLLNGCVNDLLSKVRDLNNELDLDKNYDNSNVMIVIENDNETLERIPRSKNNTEKVNKPQEDIGIKINLQNKENKPIPIERVIKYPRIKEAIKEDRPIIKVNSPTISLEGGKLVIAPLSTNSSSIPKYNTYSCTSCTSIFTTYRSLKEHEKTYHKTIIYKCRFCGKKYNSQQYLDVHYINDHAKKRCRYCHEVFDMKEINDHLRSKHENQMHICQYCDLVCYTVEQLETHLKSTHLSNNVQTNKNNNQCVMCLRNFNDIEIKNHKCKFCCLECFTAPCIHYSYLMSYREQILNHVTKIRCIDCDFTTKRKEQLIAHANREHLDHHPFTCDDCGTQFYTKLSLKTHIVQFHQDFKCQYCDHDFKNAKLLRSHKHLCKSIMRLHPCEICVASFDTVSELKKHTNQNHSVLVFPCTLCKKEFSHESALKEHHIRIHSGIQCKKRRKFIECTLCDVTFKNMKEMVQHEELHDINESYPCKVCTKSFTSLRKLYVHKQKHYTQRTKCYACNKFVGSAYFNRHIEICIRFKTDSPYICGLCGKGFKDEKALKTHELLHATPQPCIYCDKLVKPSSMKKHIDLKHSVDPKIQKTIFKCEYCNYTTRKRNECENHINKLHLKIKPYVCELCSKAFCGKGRLDQHLKTHSDNDICFCTFCGKQFANKVCLKMHTRRHTGEKPYECNICLERFRSSSIMKTHRLKKHQDKTIQCPLCDSMHHLMADMRFHVKKVHWKRPEPFDFKQIVPEEFYHLFEDRRLQKLGQPGL